MSLGIFLQPMSLATGWSRTSISTAALLNFLCMGPASFLWGALSDRFGTRVVVLSGAVLLATSPVYEIQSYRVGRVCWALQPHIETTAEIIRDWAESDRDRVDADIDALLRRSDSAHVDIEETWQPFAQRFAGVLRDPASDRKSVV